MLNNIIEICYQKILYYLTHAKLDTDFLTPIHYCLDCILAMTGGINNINISNLIQLNECSDLINYDLLCDNIMDLDDIRKLVCHWKLNTIVLDPLLIQKIKIYNNICRKLIHTKYILTPNTAEELLIYNKDIYFMPQSKIESYVIHNLI